VARGSGEEDARDVECVENLVGWIPQPCCCQEIDVEAGTVSNRLPTAEELGQLSQRRIGARRATEIFLPNIGIFGNGHTMAAELNNEQIADVLQNWINQHVKGARTEGDE